MAAGKTKFADLKPEVVPLIRKQHIELVAGEVASGGFDQLYELTGIGKPPEKNGRWLYFQGSIYPTKAFSFRVFQLAADIDSKRKDFEDEKDRITPDSLIGPLKKLGCVDRVDSPETFYETENERHRVYTKQLYRPEQTKFRSALIRTYGGKCVISASTILECVEAAHIRPVADEGTDRLENGLLLRADLHRLFDADLMAICPNDMRVYFARHCAEHYSEFSEKKVALASNIDLGGLDVRWKEFSDKHL